MSATEVVRAPDVAIPVGEGSRWPVATAAVVCLGACVAVVVASDGSTLWRCGRVVVVVGLTVAAGTVIRCGPDLHRRLVAFATGLVGLAVGLGIGLPHLAKHGDFVLTACGLGALLAGMVLYAAGAGGLIRGAHAWRRFPMAFGLVVVTYVVLWSLSIAIAATNVPATTLGAATPADRGLTYSNVEFETADGVTLSGWYVPSTNGAAVALLHGAGSTRSNVLDQAEVLAGHGYGVLLYDARGHGLSGGRAMDFGWYGDEDIAAAVSFLDARPEIDGNRIGAVGLSMGGEQAIGAAASVDGIAAVVAEGATNRVSADKQWLSDEHGIRGVVQEAIDWLLYGATDLLTDARPPTSLRAAAASSGRPMLLIAAGEVPDEPNAAEFVRAGSPEQVEVWIADGAGHTDALETHPEAWENRVVGFLERELDNPTGGPAG